MQDTAATFFKLARFGEQPWETNFRSEPVVQWTAENYHIPVIALTLYLLFLRYGTQYMEKRAAFDLQTPLILWNAFLAIFSFLGMCRTVPFLFGKLLTVPTYHHLVCDNVTENSDFFEGPVGLWAAAFMASKIPELIDTVFIVLRKKPLGFLHWYHHVTVLAYCWHAYSQRTESGVIFLSMNYFVHAVMYTYYCCQAMKVVPRSFPSQIITLAQIAQMVVGTHATVVAALALYAGQKCNASVENTVAAVLMYGSYLYLFVEFAVKRYIFKKPAAKKAAEKKAE